MFITEISLKNWRNFPKADVKIGFRSFFVGPNASGKSNFLDAIRFLRDLAQTGGGLQKAVEIRGGISKIRCLSARQDPDVQLEVSLSETPNGPSIWKYEIGIKQEPRGNRLPYIAFERVYKNNALILKRPNDGDKKDQVRLTQTYLEQLSTNAEFREIAKFFDSIQYLHIVPQLVRHSDSYSGPGVPGDPFGLHFLEKLSLTPDRTRKSRLKRIQAALKLAVPQLEELEYVQDKGHSHLEAKYAHWRPHGGKQREDQFSDGTLRLIGLMWALLDGDALLLLEEPELSLHSGIVKAIPALMFRLVGKKRQIIITTHSTDLLSDKGIGAAETIILKPSKEGTTAQVSSDNEQIVALLQSGLSVADVVIPRTRPANLDQLELFSYDSN
ncbi:MAG: AAA family ATPase [Deltaproteobacteria bacterium]|nr:AAA family ATPase [Deltaproteobacteria bacterium]